MTIEGLLISVLTVVCAGQLLISLQARDRLEQIIDALKKDG